MGVTFMLPGEFREVTRAEHTSALNTPCPDCGGHDTYAPLEKRTNADPECHTCYGDGGSMKAMDAYFARQSDVDGEFNVANANAAFIVQEILNLSHQEVYGGSLDPATVLMRLAVYFDPSKGVEAPSETQAVRLTMEGVGLGCTVLNMGRSQTQVERYLHSLRKLAELAVERGSPEIYWG